MVPPAVPGMSTEPWFRPSDLILNGLHSSATRGQIPAWGMYSGAGCLIHPNLLALGSSQISFIANRANSYIKLEQMNYLGSFYVNQTQNISVFISVVRHLGRRAVC